MRILVTGSNGYLGKGVVKQLLDDGCVVIATDLDDKHIDPRAKIVVGNIFEMENPFTILGEPDILLHMAWRDGFVHNSVNHINDLPKHVQFLRKMIDSGVKKLAVMGTMHEIGFFEGCINEKTPCNPSTLYGISKNALRNIVEEDCKKANVVFQWLRGFYIVGNTADGASIFSRLIRANAEGNEKFPFTDGTNQYDFVDYDVFCQYVAKCVEQDKVDGIINICSGRPEKIGDRVERFIFENNLNLKLQYGAYPNRPYDSKAIWGDNTKINKILSDYTKTHIKEAK